MKRTPCYSALLIASLALLLGAGTREEPNYSFLKEVPIGGGSGWDYLSCDPAAHRLYVTHRTKVMVIDTTTDKVVGTVVDTPGVHGFALAPDLHRGFASNGQENKVSIVDLETLKTLSKVETGVNPDAILYEPISHEVWSFNGRGKSATVFDGSTGKVIAAGIELGGKPETGVADASAGRVYVNLEDKNEIVVLDLKEHKVLERWPIAPGETATGMAIDPILHRLIVGCGNSKMLMMDSASGKVISSIDCGQGVDAAAFDPDTHLAFVSAGGSGTVTVARVEQDKLVPVQTLATERGARTMTVDAVSHKIYLSNAKSRTDADSFKVLIYGMGDGAKR